MAKSRVRNTKQQNVCQTGASEAPSEAVAEPSREGVAPPAIQASTDPAIAILAALYVVAEIAARRGTVGAAFLTLAVSMAQHAYTAGREGGGLLVRSVGATVRAAMPRRESPEQSVYDVVWRGLVALAFVAEGNRADARGIYFRELDEGGDQRATVRAAVASAFQGLSPAERERIEQHAGADLEKRLPDTEPAPAPTPPPEPPPFPASAGFASAGGAA